MEVKTCIVKIEKRPNEETDPRDPPLLVYDRGKTFVEFVAARDEPRIMRELGGAMAGFFEATRDGRWVIGERVPDREW